MHFPATFFDFFWTNQKLSRKKKKNKKKNARGTCSTSTSTFFISRPEPSTHSQKMRVFLALSGLSLFTLCALIPFFFPPYGGGYLPGMGPVATPAAAAVDGSDASAAADAAAAVEPLTVRAPRDLVASVLRRYDAALPAAISLELLLLGSVFVALLVVEGSLSGLRMLNAYVLLGAWFTGMSPVAALFCARARASRNDRGRMPRMFAIGAAIVYVVGSVVGGIAMSTASVLERPARGKAAAAAAAAAAAGGGGLPHPLTTPFGASVVATVVALPLLLVLTHRAAPLKTSDDAEGNTHNARTLYSVAFGAAVSLFAMTRVKLLAYIIMSGASPASIYETVVASSLSSYSAAFVTADLAFLTAISVLYVFSSDADISTPKRALFALFVAVAPAMGFSAFLAVTSRTKRFSTVKYE
jgi:hypothetical protein